MLLIFLILTFAGPAFVVLSGKVDLKADWRTATREVAGQAPDPLAHRGALVHVYAARAFNWRGAFAVHTWISVKPENAATWTVHQVVGWRKRRGLPVVVSEPDAPDRLWYGQQPVLIGSLEGEAARTAIEKIDLAVARYPWPDEYRVWPGPNSNTFVAWVAREVPELAVRLPVTAIGKDWLGTSNFVVTAPSNTGYQFSLFGVLGGVVARTEGLELNLLGTGYGIDVARPALSLPGLGRIGMPAVAPTPYQ